MAGMVQFQAKNGETITASADVWIGAMLAELPPETAERIMRRVVDLQAQIDEITRQRRLEIPPPLEIAKVLNGGPSRARQG